VTVIHQDHDYAHLPDGKPHYRLPESERNLELAGGRPSVFSLKDSDWVYAGGRMQPRRVELNHLLRRAEVAIYLALGPGRAARRARLLMHPIETLRSIRSRRAEDSG
jgi:hypothetical protein